MNRSLATILSLVGAAGLAACSPASTTCTLPAGLPPGVVLQLISLTPPSPTLASGASQQLTATGKYSDGSTANITGLVTWASLDGTVATVTGGRVVGSPSGGGTTVITATLGEQVGFTTVTVTGGQLQLISLTPPSPTLARGASQQLHATGKYTNGSTADLTGLVTWASLDGTVATVTGGLVVGNPLSGGTTVITATLGEQVGFTTVTVAGGQLGFVYLDPPEVTIPRGVPLRPMRVMGVYAGGTEVDLTSAATWDSANPATLTVAAGAMTGVGPGNVGVTASVGGFTVAGAVTVSTGNLSALTIAPGNAPTAKVGRVEGFIALGEFSDGSRWDLTDAVTWSSAVSAVATISNAPGTRGQATAVAPGVTDVTATLGGLSATQALTITNDARDYTVERIPFEWTGMGPTPGSPAGRVLVSGDSELTALPVVDGFKFDFFETSYATTELQVSTNGVLFFGAGTGSTTSYGPWQIPDDTRNGFVALYWNDLVCKVTMKVVGAAPGRQLVLEWDGQRWAGDEPVRFQLVLTEGTNVIEARYLMVPTVHNYLVVGLQDPTGTVGTQLGSDTPSVVPFLALRFRP